MTDSMRWVVVSTGCAVALLFTVIAMTVLIPGSPPDPGCIGHGGVTTIHESGDTSTVYFVCRDGKVVSRP